VFKVIKSKVKGVLAVTSVILFVFTSVVLCLRQMESLGRGVISVNQGDGRVFVSWRLFGTDPDSLAFNLYRSSDGGKTVKLNDQALTTAANFVDEKADLTKSNSYFVRPVLNTREQEASKSFTLPANSPVQQDLSVPLQTPPGYSPNDTSVGDLDDDGEYEIAVHMTWRGRDNASPGLTAPRLSGIQT
jgi:rhamnogalacturonan endolyase